MACLVALNGPDAGRRYELRDETVLGRHPDCDVTIDVGAVGRYHAKVTREDDNYFLADLKSRNGTLVNQRFVTLLLAEVNSQSHTLTVVNAGHLPPLIFRHSSAAVEAIGTNAAGLPAGVLEDADYEAITTAIDPQDRILLYTDGIIERMNANNDVYGISRLRDRFGESTAGLSETIRALVTDAHTFAGTSKLQDDFCLIACRRNR